MPDRPVRVAVYGTGRFAQATHLPNLRRIDGVEIAALCDINEDALSEAAAQFGVARTYTDAHAMLEAEDLDALWSIVPAFARTDVEIAAAERGIQLFSEKPQALGHGPGEADRCGRSEGRRHQYGRLPGTVPADLPGSPAAAPGQARRARPLSADLA